jgi:hypothetical protein
VRRELRKELIGERWVGWRRDPRKHERKEQGTNQVKNGVGSGAKRTRRRS